MERVRENLEKADMDSGFTYSNKTRRRSVVVVGLASSQAQFLNSFEHELRHLCDDIAVASAMPMQGEEVAYLTGQINTMLWKIFTNLFVAKVNATVMDKQTKYLMSLLEISECCYPIM